MCQKLHFLQLNGIYDIQVAKFMHCYINDNLPAPKNIYLFKILRYIIIILDCRYVPIYRLEKQVLLQRA